MHSCAHCGANMGESCAEGELRNACPRCRIISYCSVKCQKADWGTHRKSCKPCTEYEATVEYAFEQALAASKAKDWRKTLEWSGCFEQMMKRDAKDSTDLDNIRRSVLRVSANAYERAANATGELHYARDGLPWIRELSELYGKYESFDLQVESICLEGHLLTMALGGSIDEQVIACFQRASDIATTHGSAYSEFMTSFSLGQCAEMQGRTEDAKFLLRAAVAASKRGDGTESFAKMATREMDASSVLIQVCSILEVFSLNPNQ
jgi:hypothetical protein